MRCSKQPTNIVIAIAMVALTARSLGTALSYVGTVCKGQSGADSIAETGSLILSNFMVHLPTYICVVG